MNSDYTGHNTSNEPGGVQAQSAKSHFSRPEDPERPESEMETLLRNSDYAFRSLRRGETVEGTVVRVDQDEVMVDVGLKSEGVIPSRELYGEGEEIPVLHIGDRALVYVIHPESSDGHAILSLRRARAERSWRDIEELYHQGSILEAAVVDFNKGGLIVDVRGVRGFVPVSQVLDLRNVTRQEGEGDVSSTLAAMNGRRLPLKIIEINRSRNRLILSERAAVQERRTQRKDELIDQLEPGQVRRGVVSNLTTFGAFIDLGGADGLVHVSELSYNRVNHPSELVHVGQEVDVMVLSIDRDTKKIALSLKRAMPDPWTTVDEQYRVGQVVPAVITKLAKFGAFAKVEEGLEGLIHLSELTDLPVQDATQVVHEGQHIDVKIIHINSKGRRLGLSARQAVDPRGQMESFGEVDDNNPFATDDLATYHNGNAAGAGNSASTYPPDSLSLESEGPTDGQESLAVESEPQDLASEVHHEAEAPSATPSVALEPALPESEEDESRVATAVSQVND
jgi:small subunit ribosomal protein S1